MAPVNPPEGDPLDSLRAGETGLNPVPQGGSFRGDSMKSLMFAVLAAVGLSAAGVAQANADLAQK